MDDIDKTLKQSFENRPLPAFNEADWMAMNDKLDGASNSVSHGWVRFWWIPLLLLLIGSQAWLLIQWNKTSRQLSTITEISNNQSIIHTDTVFSSQVIYKTDTVYIQAQTSAKSHTLNSPPSSSMFEKQSIGLAGSRNQAFTSLENIYLLDQIGNSLHLFSQTLLTSGRHNAISVPNNPGMEINQDEFWSERLVTDEASAYESDDLPYLPLPDINSIVGPQWKSPHRGRFTGAPVVNHFMKAKRGAFDNFRLQGFDLEGGLGYYIMTNESLEYKNDVGLQLAALLQFSKALELWIDGTYVNQSFESYKLDDRLGLPVLEPPNPDLEFEAVETYRSSLLFSMGVLYTHPSQTRLRPQLGAGLSSSNIFAYELFYEYRNDNSGNEWLAEVNVPSVFHFPDHLVVKAGVKYALTQYWRAYTRAAYYKNIHSSFGPDIYSIQAGLSFSF